ncbi:hypothetical protein L596_007115 [Steinernema carpocapsae]|uniref:Uncharacterized protein n=1 Tax=Steinernema carpocapsae TaxID=34508 RepID=A0A4U5P8B8_STECR|nr:hypothetical protein L596_007115 [Steinernema carpocapsae]
MEETQMEKDNAGLQRTILKAIRNAPIEFHDPLMTQKSFDAVEILGSLEKAQILRRTDSDPGPTCSAKSGEDEEEKETGENGEGRDEEKANEVQKDLICIISEKDASKAEKTKKDEPKEAKADDEDSQKTLLRAVCKDDVKTVQQILKKEPNLVDSTMPYDHNYTPLHYAAKGGHRRVAQVLLASGVNIYAKTTVNFVSLLIWNPLAVQIHGPPLGGDGGRLGDA